MSTKHLTAKVSHTSAQIPIATREVTMVYVWYDAKLECTHAAEDWGWR